MSNILLFNSEQFGEVRTTVINNMPYFMLADICKALEIKDANTAKRRLSKNGVHTMHIMDRMNREQQAIFINESNIYKLAFTSRKKEAEKFTDWVTNDILPSIRKHGLQATDEIIEKVLQSPESGIKILTALKEEKEKSKTLTLMNNEQAKIIEDMKPAKQYYDNVLFANNAMNITQIAKQYGISGKKMNEILNQEKIIYKCGAEWVLYAKYAGKGYIKHHTDIIQTKYGEETKQRIKWTEKGRKLIHEIMTKLGYKPINII